MNVERHYAVVGVLEMWDSTLELLEHKLPFFFEGGKHRTYLLMFLFCGNNTYAQEQGKCTKRSSRR